MDTNNSQNDTYNSSNFSDELYCKNVIIMLSEK